MMPRSEFGKSVVAACREHAATWAAISKIVARTAVTMEDVLYENRERFAALAADIARDIGYAHLRAHVAGGPKSPKDIEAVAAHAREQVLQLFGGLGPSDAPAERVHRRHRDTVAAAEQAYGPADPPRQPYDEDEGLSDNAET